ncbi:Transposase [Roseovarius sp. THAF8]|uniref:tyrosine-type recombinase/integrase n=1 Tax=Roseovarius sp. THAF8 TaxID=2587846 RepID=UPI0012A9FB6D|nr:site-specific integrase [Roseovarius sp. THAF8]QFT97386.1 Transposase [Roseovarius sp. THAF8]
MAHITKKMVKSKGGSKRKVFAARWKGADGRKHEKIFDRKKDADAHLESVKPVPAAFERTFFGGDKLYPEVALEYLDALRGPEDGSDPIGDQTYRTYLNYLRYSARALKSFPLADIDEETMQHVRAFCVRNTKSTRAASEAFRLCKAVMGFAEEERYIGHAPGQKLKIRQSRSDRMQGRIRRADHVYTPEEVRALLVAADALSEDPQPQRRQAWVAYRALAYFLAYTGARISEARGFPRSDFIQSQQIVRIRQKATEGGAIEHPKSADGIRDIPLHPNLVEPMQAAMRAHKRDIVFSTRDGKPLELRNLYNRMWKPLLAKANELASDESNGLPNVREGGFHALRHAYASRLIAANVDLKRLQVWMGHHDPAYTVKQYGHLFEDKAADAALMEKIAI